MSCEVTTTYHPTLASYANQIDFSGVNATTTLTVLDVPLAIGQPYTLNIAEVSGNIGPVTGPASLEVRLTATGGYGTGEDVDVTRGRFGSFAIQSTGPFRVSARPLFTSATFGPVLSSWVSIEPTVPVSWPILSGVEAVPAVFTTVALNQGFPAPYRPNLTLQANGNIDVRTIDRAGNAVGNFAALTPLQAGQLFHSFPVDPLLRLQVQQGLAPAATFVSIAWS